MLEALENLTVSEIVDWAPWALLAAAAIGVGISVIIAQITESRQKENILFYYKERAMVAGIVGIMELSWCAILFLFYINDWNKLHILWLGPLSFFASIPIGLSISPFIRRLLFVFSDRWDWPD